MPLRTIPHAVNVISGPAEEPSGRATGLPQCGPPPDCARSHFIQTRRSRNGCFRWKTMARYRPRLPRTHIRASPCLRLRNILRSPPPLQLPIRLRPSLCSRYQARSRLDARVHFPCAATCFSQKAPRTRRCACSRISPGHSRMRSSNGFLWRAYRARLASSYPGRFPAIADRNRPAALMAERACCSAGSRFRASSTSLRIAAEAPLGCCSSHSQCRGSNDTSRATTPSFGRPGPTRAGATR